MKCVIFSGADINDYALAAKEAAGADFIVCADSGIRHAAEIGIQADVWVGDFDSAGERHGRFRIKQTLPCEKDDTDTFSAAKIALAHGATEVTLMGCIGCRMDHTLGNIFVLNYLYQHGVDARIVDEHNEIRMLTDGTARIERKDGAFLSVLPFGCTAHGVTLSGVKYALSGSDLDCTFPIGVSNRIEKDFAVVTVENGTLAIFLSRD
jgi:thiamine pyrophosphokinase